MCATVPKPSLVFTESLRDQRTAAFHPDAHTATEMVGFAAGWAVSIVFPLN